MKQLNSFLELFAYKQYPGKTQLSVFSIFILGLIFLPGTVFGYTFSFMPVDTLVIYVDPDSNFTTIQSAIDAASDGDLVLVPPGVYTEQIDFSGKNIQVKSVEGPEVTTINAGGAQSAVVFDQGEAFLYYCNVTETYVTDPWLCPGNDVSFHGAVLEGFTITGGGSQGSPTGGSEGNDGPIFNATGLVKSDNSKGGGLFISNSSPALRNLIIKGNWAGKGGAIYFYQSASKLMNILMFDNESEYGGAVFVDHCSRPPLFVNTTITENTADVGGGIYVAKSGKISIVNSIIWNNGNEEIYKQWGGLSFFPSIKIASSNIEGASDAFGPPWNPGDICGAFSGTNLGIWYFCCIDNNPEFTDPADGNFCIEDECTQEGGTQTPAIISEVSVDFPLHQDIEEKDYTIGSPECVPGYNSKEMGAYAICDSKTKYAAEPVKPEIQVNVMPNPVPKTGQITVEIMNEFLTPGFLQITDRYNRGIVTLPVTGELIQTVTLDNLSLPQGIYYLSIYAGGHQTGKVFLSE